MPCSTKPGNGWERAWLTPRNGVGMIVITVRAKRKLMSQEISVAQNNSGKMPCQQAWGTLKARENPLGRERRAEVSRGGKTEGPKTQRGASPSRSASPGPRALNVAQSTQEDGREQPADAPVLLMGWKEAPSFQKQFVTTFSRAIKPLTLWPRTLLSVRSELKTTIRREIINGSKGAATLCQMPC